MTDDCHRSTARTRLQQQAKLTLLSLLREYPRRSTTTAATEPKFRLSSCLAMTLRGNAAPAISVDLRHLRSHFTGGWCEEHVISERWGVHRLNAK